MGRRWEENRGRSTGIKRTLLPSSVTRNACGWVKEAVKKIKKKGVLLRYDGWQASR